MISLKNVIVKKGGQQIVRGASFKIKPGRITVLLGRNGAGKSTVFEAITGSNKISGGQILWDGEPMNRLSSHALAQRRAVISQSVSLHFPLRVKEVVEMGCYAAEQALSTQKKEALLDYALSKTALLDKKEQTYQTLSGGEQKRAMLAKCMVQLHATRRADKHQYLFMDEPSAHLDITQQYKLLETIQFLVRRWQIGVFVILHDINLAAQLADDILLMRSGQIIHQGSPVDVLTASNLREALDIQCMVQQHPVLGGPHIISLPETTVFNPLNNRA
ncbi:MAG: ATP-binding cassette domain-containing protein [Saprospiraceae bacterium]|nr:ATP-binding cassette domain-containing protein [Saprospiraceae bacterium]